MTWGMEVVLNSAVLNGGGRTKYIATSASEKKLNEVAQSSPVRNHQSKVVNWFEVQKASKRTNLDPGTHERRISVKPIRLVQNFSKQ